ncbi:MAG TPA: dihydrofolate reductase [Lentisphaeria bacterium]|jgi:dihydrofolate reductase|nr:dihydrofolate reductase [Lentisphaeria bacterium]
MIIIAAIARNGIIGRDNTLPWRLPSDLKRFRKLTTGQAIVMGRKTWESLPFALPKRLNLVMTRNPTYEADGATCVTTLAESAKLAAAQDLYVIGGRAIYAAALPLATRLELTWVDADVAGDVAFPDLDLAAWECVSESARQEDGDYPYRFATYERKT